ncbi:MAG: hypothetical protein HPM95_18725 [Alphaproteobacteria bacterium]|nr:hypothetical protein [Alphaproteobacteria bacterium]
MTRLLTRHSPALALAALVLLAAAVMARPVPVTAAELIMFEQRGCEWCERWNAEIGPIYPKTEEGRLAPCAGSTFTKNAEDLRWLRPEVFTPSFALIHEGREYGRIRGYPGEDFSGDCLPRWSRNTDKPQPTRRRRKRKGPRRGNVRPHLPSEAGSKYMLIRERKRRSGNRLTSPVSRPLPGLFWQAGKPDEL